MASYNELNALIDAYINRNGVQAITGQILNGVLKAMVEQLGRGYTIMGAAIPTTDPGTPDGPECYFASETGTYTDFDGLQVVPGELALLCYTPSDGWTKATIYEGFQEVGATIDGNVGTPSVGVSYAGGVLSFDFHDMKGNPGQNGQDGAAAGFGTIGADITGGVGTPGVSVESSGPATAKNLQFHFTNLKGETGVTSVVATVDNTTGNPACTVSLVGQQLTLAFTGLKGTQGDTGSSVDYPFTIVNNLTTDDATQALSAAQGVVLDGKVTQLEAEVGDVGYREDEPSFTLEAKYVSADTGNVSNSSNNQASSEIDVTGYTRLSYVGNTTSDSASVAGCAFYNANHNYISGVRFDLTDSYTEKVYNLDIPSGAKYFRFSIRNAFKDDAKVVLYAGESIAEQLSALQTETTALDAETKALDLKIEGRVQNYVNGYLYQDQGLFSSNDDIVCPFIPCENGDTILWYNGYSATKSVHLVFYKEDKTIAGANYYSANSVPSRTITVGANTIKFLRATFSKENPDVYLAVNNVVKWTRKDGYVGVKTEIGEWYPLTKKADFDLVAGYINGSTGNINSSSTSNYRSDLIKVYGYEKVIWVGDKLTNSASVAGAAFYDDDHQFLSGLLYYSADWAADSMTEYELKIPDGAFYFAFTIKNAEVGYASVRLVKNKTIAESVKGMLKQDGNIVPILGSPELYFSEPTSETAVELSGKTSANLYAEYDALVTAYPDYMKRDTDLGSVTVDGTSYAIAAYTFGFNKQMLIDHEPTDSEVLDNSDNVWPSYLNPRKILLVSGMHGEEHTSCWGVMLTVKAILESDEPWAHYLKDNFIFKILPCVNPYGFSINRRYDSEGNVPNRDESIDDAESTYYMNWVDANKDAFILIDCHGTQGHYAYFPVQDFLPLAELSHSLACKLSAAFLENWTEFYNGISAGYGTTYSPFLVAKKTINSWTRGRYAVRMYEDYGMQQLTIETPGDLITPDRYHSDLRNCKLTKDMLINLLQSVCGIKELPQ